VASPRGDIARQATLWQFGQTGEISHPHFAGAKLEYEVLRRPAASKELPMKVMKKYPQVLFALLFFTAGAILLSTRLAGQEDGWRVVRATYGNRSQVNDVTAILLDLLSNAATNGRILVNNQTMGGDPAPQRVKTLRVVARNSRNEEREFDYDEKSYLDVYPFSQRRDGRSDFDRDRQREQRYRTDDWRDRGDEDGFFILRGFYGVNGNTVNVTEHLRALTRASGGISTKVNNTGMGLDPAPGADKILVVIYRYQRKEQALVLQEGDTLTLP
jgi:hypothetical protein